MASSSTAATPPRKSLPSLGLPREKGDEVLGFLLAATVVLLLASFLSFHPRDPTLLHRAPETASVGNFVGPVGAQVAALGFGLLGLVAFAVPLVLAAAAWRRLARRDRMRVPGRAIGVVMVVVALPALLHIAVGEVAWRDGAFAAGGALGRILYDVLAERLNAGGATVVLLAGLAIGASLAVQSTLGDVLVAIRARVLRGWDRVLLLVEKRRRRQQKREVERRMVERHEARTEEARRAAEAADDEAPAPRLDLPLRVTERKGEGRFSVRKVHGVPPGGTLVMPEGGVPATPADAEPPAPPPTKRAATPKEVAKPKADPQSPIDFGELPASAELPPVNLLSTAAAAKAHDENELVRLGQTIETSCAEFGVEGTLEAINPGPVITVFEMQPAPGVKVSRIVNLQDDLALALRAESVRIDRMAGRSTMGLEVPNRKRSVIHLGNLLAAEAFQKSPSVLTMALGVDIHGKPYYADLTTMPHLLVAGATGAGKSVGLQSMITSILYKATRDQVQFIFIDPKRIELGVYADIPHLKTEVVVEPKKAANALRWAVGEMERRYRLLAEVHVRSIDYYNRAISDPALRERLSLKEAEGETPPDLGLDDLKPLPYYVIIIDELADLMMVAGADVETSIARLAQMARAVGIHLIVATQRPSVDVLTGTIKANFPCRLAYATATRHDSRTILDTVGAEKLLGKGDALLMPPGTSRMMRLHGAYISEQETAALVRWIKRRGKPQYDPDVVKAPEGESSAGSGDGGDDDLFDEAARLVVNERMGSASFLQRRLRVGFSRASRLIDMMEADGLLGPAQGSKPRDVLVPPDFFSEIDRTRGE